VKYTHVPQPFAYILQCRPTPAPQARTRFCQWVAARTAHHQSSYPKARRFDGSPTLCIDARTYSGRTRRNFGQSGGRICALGKFRREGSRPTVSLSHGTLAVIPVLRCGPVTAVRSLEERDANRGRRWEYIPFGGGPRICIGQQFALTQLLYVVTRMFQTFKAVEPRSDDLLKIKVSATISMVNDLLVSFVPV
jgi:hypothetical protein